MMPKGRYDIMKAYMPRVGGLGLDMMFRSCTIQARAAAGGGGGGQGSRNAPPFASVSC